MEPPIFSLELQNWFQKIATGTSFKKLELELVLAPILQQYNKKAEILAGSAAAGAVVCDTHSFRASASLRALLQVRVVLTVRLLVRSRRNARYSTLRTQKNDQV